MNGIGVWLSEGSGWNISNIDEYYNINTAVYEPTKGSSYIPLPTELKHSRKGLVNLKNEDECFLWCHIRHLNPQEKNPQWIKKLNRKMVEELNRQGIEFPVSTKDYTKIEPTVDYRGGEASNIMFWLSILIE